MKKILCLEKFLGIKIIQNKLDQKVLEHFNEWVHRDLNPGSSPCKGDVLTELDYGPSKSLVGINLNFEKVSN